MGGHFWTHIVAWTFLCSVQVVSADRGLIQDLGLDALPDVTKINISQNEYTHMMNAYLQRLQDTAQDNTIPKLITFNAEKKDWRRRRDDSTRLRFPVRPADPDMDIETAVVRFLAQPLSGCDTVRVQIFQVVGTRRKRLLDEREVFPSATASKWYEFDVTKGVQAWINGDRNLGLEVQCDACKDRLQPSQATLSVLVYPEPRRVRRSSPHLNYEQGLRTDCKTGDTKRRCCRHTMTVTFKDLNVPQMSSIIQPKSYEAGFCRGRCPLNYNHATNHSRIQSLVHRLNRKATPRVCCAPSKLAPLDILRVDPYDSTKLTLEKWDNMKVLECACS